MAQAANETTGVTADGLEVSSEKVEILPGASTDLTAMTFAIHKEDHTLGNALRHCIMQNPDVEFCGYSVPHPSLQKIHLRIQTSTNTTALDALNKGLSDLYGMCEHMLTEFEDVMRNGDYQIVDDEEAMAS
ncbi:RNA polymerase subunit AC19 [Dimargaris xerosporica]|nr:RNA polymerase subunit AC19 [Dimargaris xerosporica]KAJ1978588.1 RNA polymerase subunit AC19 [Dimargaris xerosporica]